MNDAGHDPASFFSSGLFSSREHEHRQFGARVRVKLLHDAARVVLHRALGQVQRRRDLAVALPLGDQVEHHGLALGQRIGRLLLDPTTARWFELSPDGRRLAR